MTVIFRFVKDCCEGKEKNLPFMPVTDKKKSQGVRIQLGGVEVKHDGRVSICHFEADEALGQTARRPN